MCRLFAAFAGNNTDDDDDDDDGNSAILPRKVEMSTQN